MIEMHLIGSRRFGKLKPTSDWDAIIQDSAEARAFLGAAGFICTRTLDDPEQEVLSFWRHRDYDAECFLVRSEERRITARWIIEKSHIFSLIKDKKFRKRTWRCLERCLLEVALIASEHADWQRARLREQSRLREVPLKNQSLLPSAIQKRVSAESKK
jgi:hypothetical protein